jgi:hypothetical protein
VVALGLTGCEKKSQDAKRVRVSGTVKLDGKLLTTGSISFDPGTGEPPSVCSILDGKYEGVAAVGKNRVRLSAIKKVSMKEIMKMDGPGYDTLQEINALPPRYGDKSDIVREVLPDGSNTFDFLDLKSN